MMNVIDILGDRWLYVYSTTQYGVFSYENNELKSENNLVIHSDEIQSKIDEISAIVEHVEDKQTYYDALKFMNKIQEKLK
jgi:hypothetical protein|tara:strand:- start:3468 stop:3707 length:240 start_codon:yes stop_codon:yes gene_type:complete